MTVWPVQGNRVIWRIEGGRIANWLYDSLALWSLYNSHHLYLYVAGLKEVMPPKKTLISVKKRDGLLLLCEWGLCEEVITTMVDFQNHVGQHLKEFDPDSTFEQDGCLLPAAFEKEFGQNHSAYSCSTQGTSSVKGFILQNSPASGVSVVQKSLSNHSLSSFVMLSSMLSTPNWNAKAASWCRRMRLPSALLTQLPGTPSMIIWNRSGASGIPVRWLQIHVLSWL